MERRKYLYYKKSGHYIRDCAEKKRDNREKSSDAAIGSNDLLMEVIKVLICLYQIERLKVNGFLTLDVIFIESW